MSHDSYWCPPYSLKLSAQACATYKALARDAAAHQRRQGSQQILTSKRACIDCVGVKRLAKMWRMDPAELDTSQLLASRKPRQTTQPAPRVRPDRPAHMSETIALPEIARRMAVTPDTALARLRWVHISSVGGAGNELVYDLTTIERVIDELATARRSKRSHRATASKDAITETIAAR